MKYNVTAIDKQKVLTFYHVTVLGWCGFSKRSRLAVCRSCSNAAEKKEFQLKNNYTWTDPFRSWTTPYWADDSSYFTEGEIMGVGKAIESFRKQEGRQKRSQEVYNILSEPKP